jgi:hypothetical protein
MQADKGRRNDLPAVAMRPLQVEVLSGVDG